MMFWEIAEISLMGFATKEEQYFSKIVLLKLGISAFSMLDNNINSLNFMTLALTPSEGGFKENLACLSWILEHSLNYTIYTESVSTQLPRLTANVSNTNVPNTNCSETALTFNLVKEQENTAQYSGMLNARTESVEELLSSSYEPDRTLGLLILGLDLELIKEKIMRFKKTDNFTT